MREDQHIQRISYHCAINVWSSRIVLQNRFKKFDSFPLISYKFSLQTPWSAARGLIFVDVYYAVHQAGDGGPLLNTTILGKVFCTCTLFHFEMENMVDREC
jgi:hypothetical protein